MDDWLFDRINTLTFTQPFTKHPDPPRKRLIPLPQMPNTVVDLTLDSDDQDMYSDDEVSHVSESEPEAEQVICF
jgi:hypothetical protein